MEIQNKIDESGIQTLDLQIYKPHKKDVILFDIVDFLLEGYLLQEKQFRSEMAKLHWSQFTGKDVIIYSSNDAIVPLWSYMLISTLLSNYAHTVVFFKEHQLRESFVVGKNTTNRLHLI